MSLPEFKSWPKIPRRKGLGVVITEKLDGTNGIIYIPEDLSTVIPGSRNRWISPESDNYGFAKWVNENREELKKLGPGYHYGEWWGAGIQRRYGLTEKRFSLFNTSRWGGENKDRPECCGVVPIVYYGQYTATCIEEALEKLRTGGSVAVPGWMNPEGVVVWIPATGARIKATFDGDDHKEQAA